MIRPEVRAPETVKMPAVPFPEVMLFVLISVVEAKPEICKFVLVAFVVVPFVTVRAEIVEDA